MVSSSQFDKLKSRFKIEFLSRLIAISSSSILLVFLARFLQPDSYGLLFLSIAIFEMIVIFSRFGVGKSTARYIAEYKETDPSQIPNIIKFGFLLGSLSLGAYTTLYVATQSYIPTLLNEPGLEEFLLYGAFFVILSSVLTYVRVIFQGFEHIKASSVLYALNKTLRLGLVISLVLLGYGTVGALFGYIFAFLLCCIIGLMYLYLNFLRNQSSSPPKPGLKKRIAKYSVPLTATEMGGIIDRRLDLVLVGFFLNPLAVAYYTIGKQIIAFTTAPVAALGFTLSPTYESEKARGNESGASELYEQALSNILIIYIPAATGLILVADPLIGLVFGADYSGAVSVLQILAVYTVLQAVSRITSNRLDYLGQAKKRAIIIWLTTALNVALNIILIPRIGVEGAAIATVISYFIYVLLNLYLIYLEFHFNLQEVGEIIGYTVLISVIMTLVLLPLRAVYAGILSLFLLISFGLGIWLALSIKLGLLDINTIRQSIRT